MRRAPLDGLGGDRLPGNVPGCGGRAHPSDPAGNGRDFAAVPPPVQRRPAHRPARPHDRRTCDLRLRSWRLAVGRLHSGHRSHGPARSPGRGDWGDQAAVGRGAVQPRERLVHPARRAPAALPPAGGPPLRRRLPGQPIGHDPRRQVRGGGVVDRIDVQRRPDGVAYAVELRRGSRRPSTAARSIGRTGAW